MRQGIALGEGPQGTDQPFDKEVKGFGGGALEPAAHRRGLEIGLAMSLDPVREAVAIPGGMAQEIREPGQGLQRFAAGALQVLESLLDPFVDLKAEAVERTDLVRVVGLGADLRIAAAGRLAHSLQDGPSPGMWSEAPEEVIAAELAYEVGPPPAQPRLLFTGFARPGYDNLGGKQPIELGSKELGLC
jgi:hypothetical protein